MSSPPGTLSRRRWRLRGCGLNKLSWPPRVFLAGQAVSVLGDGLAALAIPLLVLDLSRNPLLSALSAASVTVGYLLVGLPAGALADRMDPWRVLIAMDAARALLFAGLYALTVAGALRIWLVLMLALGAGACSVEKLIIYDARVTLALSPPLVGAVVAAGGAGGLAGALAAAPLARWAGEMRLVVLAIAAGGVAVASMCLASSAGTLAAANAGYGVALVVASLVNRTQRQRMVPRDLLGRVTSTVRVLFLAVDPLGVIAAGAATVALGGDPRPVFLVAGTVVIVAAGGGWAGGLRSAAGRGQPESGS